MILILPQANKQPNNIDCLECRVFEDPNDSTTVMLLWLATSSLIIEERISTEVFNDFTVQVPLLMWVLGSSPYPEELFDSVPTDQFTDLSSLNKRNTSAISAVIDLLSISENNYLQIADVISVLTEDKDLPGEDLTGSLDSVLVHSSVVLAQTMEKEDMIIHTGGQETKVGLARDYDGDEEITVHTEMTPGPVLEEESKLVDYLSALNDPKSRIKERQLKVGGHLVTVQTFHYPALNMEAPQNKRQRTYVNKENMPILFSYEAKEAMTLMLKRSITPATDEKSGKRVCYIILFLCK